MIDFLQFSFVLLPLEVAACGSGCDATYDKNAGGDGTALLQMALLGHPNMSIERPNNAWPQLQRPHPPGHIKFSEAAVTQQVEAAAGGPGGSLWSRLLQLEKRSCNLDSDCGLHMQCGDGHVCILREFGADLHLDALAGLASFVIAGISLVAGVGGGGLFVPLLMGLLSFDARTATALSQSMLTGGALAALVYNVGQAHPRTPSLPLVDFDLACLLAPALVAGAQLGSIAHAVAPPAVLLLLLCMVLIDAARKGVSSALKLSRVEETAQARSDSVAPSLASTDYIQSRVLSAQWRLFAIWMSVVVVVLLKGSVEMCSPAWWVLTGIAVALFGCTAWKCARYLRETEPLHGEALDFHEVAGTLLLWGGVAGVLAAMCGIGGGMILGPILVRLNVPPLVSSATTATTLLILASSTALIYWGRSVAPAGYSLYLSLATTAGAFVGKRLVGSWVRRTRRESVIVWCLAGITVVSALCMGGIGLRRVRHNGSASFSFGRLCHAAAP